MSEKMYDLVFEGGGAKGAVFVGAMQAFNQRGCTYRRLIGTSAGAITATLLAAGFTPDELSEAVNEKKGSKSIFASFLDVPEKNFFSDESIQASDTLGMFNSMNLDSLLFIVSSWIKKNLLDTLLHIPAYRQLFNFVEYGGVFAGEEFRRWMQGKIQRKGYDPEITLSELYSRTKVDLSLVASDTTDYNMLVLNHRTAPDCPVAWAVRMSMSIPFIWSEVLWRKEWGTYLGSSIASHRIVDGGLLSNFPIALIDKQPSAGSEEEKIMGDESAHAAGTVGLLIDETLRVLGQPETRKAGFSDKLKTIQRIDRLVDTMRTSRDNEEVRNNEQLICHLPAKGYGTTEFDMNDERRNALIAAGQKAMDAYLDRRKVTE
ncbi:patatin-like phospholipase family protein [Candidatus Electronema sp. JC]|uniref:patatin-like phospholipase family protein n=1 Tax=Candidatus Electronema sp. JC TaxID=3401570 RepID=UPI003AA823E3